MWYAGVQRLYAIALTALRESLISQLDMIEKECTSNTDLPDIPAASSLRCLPPNASDDDLPAAILQASFTTTTTPCADYLADGVAAESEHDVPRSPTFAYNPTFEPVATPSHSSSRQSLDQHDHSKDGVTSTIVPKSPVQDKACTPCHSKNLSGLSSFDSVCPALSLLPDGYAAPDSVMRSDPEVLGSTDANVQNLRTPEDACDMSCSSSESFELPILDTAESPAAMCGRTPALPCTSSQQISDVNSHEPDSCMLSINDAFANIASAQEMSRSPIIASPSQVVPLSDENVPHTSTCQCEASCGTQCASAAPDTVQIHDHMDSICSIDVRRRSMPGSVYSASAVACSAARVDVVHPSGGMLGTTSTPCGAVATPHFTTMVAPCMVRRHTLHTGEVSSLVTYPEIDEEQELGNQAPARPTSTSVLGRMLAAVDVSSCLSPVPSPDEPVPSLNHRRRRSMPSDEVLAPHRDRSFTDATGNPPRPLSGSVSMSHPGSAYGAGSVAVQVGAPWNHSAPGDMSSSSAVAGYSSDNAAFLSSQRRSRGFASFRQSLRKSIKSFGGLSRGRESNCGDAADAAAISDDDISMSLCPICMDAEVAVSVQKCSHSLCVDCARRICVTAVKPVQCPLCRTTVDKFVKVQSM